ARPSAQNGIEPSTSAPPSSSHVAAESRTPPNAAPSAHSNTTTMAANAMLVSIFATMYAKGGIGLARFTSSQPWPRSIATLTPNPNSAQPMTPNAPYVASRYVPTVVAPMPRDAPM